jgi:hypothetical protein
VDVHSGGAFFECLADIETHSPFGKGADGDAGTGIMTVGFLFNMIL